MHYAKFLTVSQVVESPQKKNEPLSKYPSTLKQQWQETESGVHYSKNHKIFSSQISQTINHQQDQTYLMESPQPKYQQQRQGITNPQAHKMRKFVLNRKDESLKKQFHQYKIRKCSENNIALENWESKRDKPPNVASSAFIQQQIDRSPKLVHQKKQRKKSCNVDLTSFFKKGERRIVDFNMEPEKQVRKKNLIKKRSLRWDQNNSFQLSTNFNSDSTQGQEESMDSILQIPKIENIRKQSEGQTTRKPVPSFINSRFHRNSLDIMDLSIKSKLGIQNFIIVRQLGSGTFGRVVLAIDRVTKMLCAIKIMSKRQIRQSNMQQQLVRQLKLQLYINHPNIIKTYGYFDDLLYFYIIMECAFDGHMSQKLKKQTTPTSQLQISGIMNQICQAISHLHSQSIIHRDLKPQNIMFHENVIKITDFGWSVYKEGKLRSTFCGTPIYLCPEILVGDYYDESVDIWTLGVILYELYYKSNPFKITRQEQLINILNQPISFDQTVNISECAKNFIQMCLMKKAVERPNIRQLLLHQFILKAVVEQQKRQR